ncbi:MAG: hypothetical protein CMH32_03395 [Micavibrio sp.]|nr:hypothetical protein [Micavibrio sp.]
MGRFNAQLYLDGLSGMAERDIDVAEAAVAIAARGYQGRSLERYIHHIKAMHEQVGERHKELLEAGAADDVDTRTAALKHVLRDVHDYRGDLEGFDSIVNANMIEVIDNRKGLPVALGILYLSCAHANGWEAEGLNFPGHFIIRLGMGNERQIVDPFNDLKKLGAPELRGLAKEYLGEEAELSADFYNPMTRRDVLIRLQNNIKLRLIEMEDYEEALNIVTEMERVAPEETRLWLDAGVLLAKIGHRQAAIDKLEKYVSTDIPWQEKQDIEQFLYELRASLN